MGKNKITKVCRGTNYYQMLYSQPEMKLDNFELKGNGEKVFKMTIPIVLELGCGKGEYTLGMAKPFLKKILSE